MVYEVNKAAITFKGNDEIDIAIGDNVEVFERREKTQMQSDLKKYTGKLTGVELDYDGTIQWFQIQTNDGVVNLRAVNVTSIVKK